ncbi:hypothetical protein BJ170DRAFT_594245 [Xylariales sp. AK1849]|nr:hypothetical protein BJ170DRAFT_594245 [Xylariales sp. AK1849]
MGQIYYYYYEVDGSTETFDPSAPTTNVCPYLPGQTINTMEVPIEHSPRARSASMSSVHIGDFKTLDPKDKFTAPRPAPPVPDSFGVRIGTSPSIPLNHKRSARSLSPPPSWTGVARRFFGGLRSSSRGSERARNLESSDSEDARSTSSGRIEGTRSTTPSNSSHSRDVCPESLRRFLSDDAPTVLPAAEQGQKLWIPEDIAEENEDDDNFATSAISESLPFTTLSPPPFQRSLSSSSVAAPNNESTVTIVPETVVSHPDMTAAVKAHDARPRFRLDIPKSDCSFSTISSNLTSPNSPHSFKSRHNSNFSFFDESNDEDHGDLSSSLDDWVGSQREHVPGSISQPFEGYSLPQPTVKSPKPLAMGQIGHPLGSSELLAPNVNGAPFGNTTLLSLKGIDAGLDDLVSEIGWIADII